MANPIRQLAGETVIYGLSTILARIVNFLLVPLYTRVLSTSEYGVVTEFMTYIAILQVLLVMGLETGCFRYASKSGVDHNSVFSNALLSVSALCLLFFGCAAIWSAEIASGLGYDGHAEVVIYVAAILALDCPLSIIFAKLRHGHKALKFAIIKTLKIFTEIGINLLLYLVMPARFASIPDHWILHFISPKPDFTYAIFAVFVSCILCLILLLPELFRIRYSIDVALLKKLFTYSFPLMVGGLPGVMNDFMDRILMRFVNSDPVMWRADLGVYQAGVKIAVLMQLFTQMFRYAAEPFYFQREREKGSRQVNAKVLNWFTAFCMLGFVAIMLYMDEIGLILGRDFRAGLSIAPIMLMAYIVNGMFFNVSMWYKLTENTKYAVWITLIGLAVSLVINLAFMPVYSYHAAAWGHLASYVTMLVLTAVLGRKYYYIPYDWGLLVGIIALGLGVWGTSLFLPQMSFLLEFFINALLVMIYAAVSFIILRYNDRRGAKESFE